MRKGVVFSWIIYYYKIKSIYKDKQESDYFCVSHDPKSIGQGKFRIKNDITEANPENPEVQKAYRKSCPKII
jgi:hypothetical protein